MKVTRAGLSIALALLVLGAGLWQLRQPADSTIPEGRPQATAPQTEATTPRSAVVAAAPRRDLSIDERQGGHTLARHVARSNEELRDRLKREPGISAASTYSDRATAEATIARALVRDDRRIAEWQARKGNRPNLALTYHGPPTEPIGRSVLRGRDAPVPCFDAAVVLRWDGRGGYYVLTSYPEANR